MMRSTTGKQPSPAPSRRAAVILMAISVLAILTILVMALAFSSQSSQSTASALESTLDLRQLAHDGLDAALAHLATGGSTTHQSEPASLQLGKAAGSFSFEVRPAAAADTAGPKALPVYGHPHLKPRTGDLLVSVRAQWQRPGGRIHGIEQVYLLNTRPDAPRRILLCESPISPTTP